MAGNNAVSGGEITLRLHASTCLATFREKKFEMAREKTMPIGIRNLATLTALAAAAAVVAAPASAQTNTIPGRAIPRSPNNRYEFDFFCS